MRRLALICVITVGIVVIVFLLPEKIHAPAVNPDPNHTHADFAVWIDGEQLDFSGPENMSGSSTDENHDNEKGLRKYLHLHDNNGHVIHRHKPGLTVADFFDTLQVGFLEKCYVSFVPLADGVICSDHPFRLFVNGAEKPFDPKFAFTDLDRILITTASMPEEVQKELDILTNDACLYSRTCPERGDPPTEGCIADPTVPCVVQ